MSRRVMNLAHLVTQNARRHGLFTGKAIGERKQIRDLLGEARKLLRGMK